MRPRISALVAVLALLPAASAFAKPVVYVCDPAHTYPSFSADHLGGLSVWRGKFTRTTCTIVMDRKARGGTVDVSVDTASVDFGNAMLNRDALGRELFDVAEYPTATYTGRLADFKNGAPTEVIGRFTLHGVTRPLTLVIRHFECKELLVMGQYRCGADATGEFDRARYGMSFGKLFGFQMWVRLHIQVEAVRHG